MTVYFYLTFVIPGGERAVIIEEGVGELFSQTFLRESSFRSSHWDMGHAVTTTLRTSPLL
jgi:hypothetical protein